jgi:hypothetical protein
MHKSVKFWCYNIVRPSILMVKIIKSIVFGEHQLVINFENIFVIVVLDPSSFEILI